MILTREEARTFLTGHLGLNTFEYDADASGLEQLLLRLRCIQLDPLDPMGTSPDMTALARIPDYRRGDLYRHLMPGRAFEHFAKERCLLPAYAFPWYAGRIAETPWWRLGERLKRTPPEAITAVLEEVRERGPISAGDLSDLGRVTPLDWSGWKGTGKLATMALQILWTRCQVVIAGRNVSKDKLYDLPERALPGLGAVDGDFGAWAIRERVEAAGILSMAGGPHWSMLSDERTSDLPDRLVAEGHLSYAVIEDSSRRYLVPADFRERRFPEPDEHMRILAPLDPLLWDRKLVEHIFGFYYVWEVYKPAAQRRWGWYVCPLLHRGRLVGRLEGRVREDVLEIDHVWCEPGERINRRALDAALKRHVRACGVRTFTRPKKFA